MVDQPSPGQPPQQDLPVRVGPELRQHDDIRSVLGQAVGDGDDAPTPAVSDIQLQEKRHGNPVGCCTLCFFVFLVDRATRPRPKHLPR